MFGENIYYPLRYPAISQFTENKINVFGEPLQEMVVKKAIQVENRKGEKVNIVPVATYDISAKIIINERYPNFWNVAGLDDLLTNDLVLVWGRLSEGRYLEKIKFSHQWTYMTFSYTDEELNSDLGNEYIKNHVSSNHLIAANKNIDHALRQLQRNDLIRIQGHLVDIQISDQPIIHTSTVRTDNWRMGQGNTGGSEFVYVTELQEGNRLYK